MKKPSTLAQLLEELQGENIRSDVEVNRQSKAIIYPNDHAAEADDGIELTAKECVLVFSSPAAIERLVDALETEDATIALFDVGLSGENMEALERGFIAVDEG